MLDSLIHSCVNNFDFFAYAIAVVMFFFGIWLGLFIGYAWGANNYKK